MSRFVVPRSLRYAPLSLYFLLKNNNFEMWQECQEFVNILVCAKNNVESPFSYSHMINELKNIKNEKKVKPCLPLIHGLAVSIIALILAA